MREWKDLSENERLEYIFRVPADDIGISIPKYIERRIRNEYPMLEVYDEGTPIIPALSFIIAGVVAFIALFVLIFSRPWALILFLVAVIATLIGIIYITKYSKRIDLLSDYEWHTFIMGDKEVIRKNSFYGRKTGIKEGDKILLWLKKLNIIYNIDFSDNNYIYINLRNLDKNMEEEFMKRNYINGKKPDTPKPLTEPLTKMTPDELVEEVRKNENKEEKREDKAVDEEDIQVDEDDIKIVRF